MAKALLIKSYTSKTGSQGKWNDDFTDPKSYIQGIATGSILNNLNAETAASLISGLPTPWARAKLFEFALNTLANPNPKIGVTGLVAYYKILHDEWRGLLAVIALYPDRIKFSEPIYMDVDGSDYDIASAMGRMLFDDKDLWSNQHLLSADPKTQPYIQLIHYKGHLIGGTSPLTGCFTGIHYDLGSDAKDIPWYVGGKFIDPTQSKLDPAQLQKLYLFVKNLNDNISDYENLLFSCRPNKGKLSGLRTMVSKWVDEIKKVATNTLSEVGPVPKFKILESPFKELFKFDLPVYFYQNKFTYTAPADAAGIQIPDVQDLLSDDDYIIGFPEGDANHRLSDASVYYLKVEDKSNQQMWYFTVPLSELGVTIFRTRMGSLLGYAPSTDSLSISADTVMEGKSLSVSMTVEIDGNAVALNTREYKIVYKSIPSKFVLWPNFRSDKWTNYYMYSEFTSDAKMHFSPLFSDAANKIVTNGTGSNPDQFYVPEMETKKVTDDANVTNVTIAPLIVYPAGKVSESKPRYNILRADKPIAGLSATVSDNGKEQHAGYLLLKDDKVPDLSNSQIQCNNAEVGIDFGSNNTCVYYKDSTKEVSLPVQFENDRVVLVGAESDDEKAIAENNELLFFSNYPSDNGQMKSWLHEHDSNYNANYEVDEVAGGVPVNRPNIMVEKMDQYEITTQAGILHYNMKWLNDDKGAQKKTSFLKTIWLQTLAYLYKNRMTPSVLRWSYPGAMSPSEKNDLGRIYGQVILVNPVNPVNATVKIEKEVTEAEAVCSYTNSLNYGLNSNNILLGIDVGGSTTDIQIVAKNINQPSLFRESSIRLAAGVFFNAIIKSDQFKEALYSFHEGHKTKVYVANIQEMKNSKEKAPYYLNSIFDQLHTSVDYNAFYSSLYSNAKFVFTIPAYVTGLLLFYSGMLVGKTIKDKNLTEINTVDVNSFGKGGLLFQWLGCATSTSAMNDYYAACLNAGAKAMGCADLTVNYRTQNLEDNKAEVAKGLCLNQALPKVFEAMDSDICGETGVRFISSDGSRQDIKPDEELKSDKFGNNMNGFDFSAVSNFKDFMNIFVDFVSVRTNLYPDAKTLLQDKITDLPGRVSRYICNDTEYIKACKDVNGFSYHQPIIIAEGCCFLDDLINAIFSK